MISIAYILFVVLLLMSFFFGERWPFSSYPMFSKKVKSKTTTLFLIRVASEENQSKKWISLKKMDLKQIDIKLKLAILNESINDELVLLKQILPIIQKQCSLNSFDTVEIVKRVIAGEKQEDVLFNSYSLKQLKE